MVRTKGKRSTPRKRKKLLKEAKGFKWGRKSLYRRAKEALIHARKYAYRDRRTKKRDFRKLWQTQINAAVRDCGLSYSKFIHALKEKNIELNRKILAQLAKEKPKIFKKIVEKAKR